MCGFAWIVVLSIPFFPPLHGRCLVKVRRERKRSVNAHRRVWFFSSSCIFYISLSCAERAETRSYTRPHLLPQYSLDRQKKREKGLLLMLLPTEKPSFHRHPSRSRILRISPTRVYKTKKRKKKTEAHALAK